MLAPCRDGVPLEEPFVLENLPNGPWQGAIAYLDRDGVLNFGSENYINSVDELKVIPGAADAVARLRENGFRIVVVTNQSPIGRGHWSSENLAMIHAELQQRLLDENPNAILDLILHSPWAPWDGSWARKPNPGMLEAGRQLIEAAEGNDGAGFGDDLSIRFGDFWQNRADESTSVMVGDRSVDMLAAEAFGVRGFRCDKLVGIADVIDEILGGAA